MITVLCTLPSGIEARRQGDEKTRRREDEETRVRTILSVERCLLEDCKIGEKDLSTCRATNDDTIGVGPHLVGVRPTISGQFQAHIGIHSQAPIPNPHSNAIKTMVWCWIWV